MLQSFKTLTFNVVPVVLLFAVVGASFWLVQTDKSVAIANPATGDPGPVSALATPVIPQSVVVEVMSSSKTIASADASTLSEEEDSEATGAEEVAVTEPSAEQTPATKEQVWTEITEAISGLNELVGSEMFVDVERKQKGQMEIRLDGDLWKRVRYQTRVDLKTDISDLWHLYVKEYGHEGSSVVYFMNDSDDRVIDIFSKAQ